jgi:hypothetical protein
MLARRRPVVLHVVHMVRVRREPRRVTALPAPLAPLAALDLGRSGSRRIRRGRLRRVLGVLRQLRLQLHDLRLRRGQLRAKRNHQRNQIVVCRRRRDLPIQIRSQWMSRRKGVNGYPPERIQVRCVRTPQAPTSRQTRVARAPAPVVPGTHASQHVFERSPGAATRPLPRGYRPRRPQATTFYRVIADHLETMLQDARDRSPHGFPVAASRRGQLPSLARLRRRGTRLRARRVPVVSVRDPRPVQLPGPRHT